MGIYYNYDVYFRDEEGEAQSSRVSCPGPHRAPGAGGCLFLLFPTPSFPLAAVAASARGAEPKCARSQATEKPHTQHIEWAQPAAGSLRDKGLTDPI